jgi:hypothetical protein
LGPWSCKNSLRKSITSFHSHLTLLPEKIQAIFLSSSFTAPTGPWPPISVS